VISPKKTFQPIKKHVILSISKPSFMPHLDKYSPHVANGKKVGQRLTKNEDFLSLKFNLAHFEAMLNTSLF